MKKTILFFLIILFSISVYAVCDIEETINLNIINEYSITDKDYNVTLTNFQNESGELSVKIKINKETTDYLNQDDSHTFEDLSEITISSITKISASNVSSQICLSAGLKCIDCGTCSSTKECDDNNTCTIYECDGDPLRCKHKLILWCKDDDGCCHSICTKENDNDCGISGICINNSDCNDNNLTTKDICEGSPRSCTHITITNCTSNDSYCPLGCNFTMDTDCDECSINSDCNDNNSCTFDTCSNNPKKCYNNQTSGCSINNLCFSHGSIINNQFCDTDNTMKQQKKNKEPCTKNYNCLSYICRKNKCRNLPFTTILSAWFKSLFGK